MEGFLWDLLIQELNKAAGWEINKIRKIEMTKSRSNTVSTTNNARDYGLKLL